MGDDDTNAYKEAIERYLKTGKATGQPRQVMAAVQPLMRYRLMHHLGETLGYESRDLFAGERAINYTQKVPNRLAAVLKKLQVWYQPARKVLKAMSMAMEKDQDINIWATNVSDVSGAPAVFAQNVKTLVKSTLNSQRANLHKIQANLQTLSYMMGWHMTVS